MPAQSAGSLWSSCCTRCEGTMTTRSTWSACPPACAGGWPWRGPAAGPRSGATACAGGPPTTTPRLAEAGLRGLTAHRGRAQLRGPPTPPPSRFPRPALLGSQQRGAPPSARLALLLLRTHATAQCSCSPSGSTSGASNKHPDAFRACVFYDQRATQRRECFPTLSRLCGKAKGEDFSGCTISSHLSAAAGDASLVLSQPPTPEHQGRAAQESLAVSPGNPLLRA